jgi:hypothetical protein
VNLIFRYLQGATNVGTVFDKDIGLSSNVIGYVDLDYAGDLVVTRGDIILKKIASEENPVNMLTKPIPVLKFKSCLDLIVICSL